DPSPARECDQPAQHHDSRDPVRDRTETRRPQRDCGVTGVEQHPGTGGPARCGLGCSGEERGDRPGCAEHEGEQEQGDEADEGGVGQFLTHRPTLPLRGTHRSSCTMTVPEARPTTTTGPKAVSGGVMVPFSSAATSSTIWPRNTVSPGKNPTNRPESSAGEAGVSAAASSSTGAGVSGSGSGARRGRWAWMMSVK